MVSTVDTTSNKKIFDMNHGSICSAAKSLFVAVPQEGAKSARVDIFEPINASSGEVRDSEPQETVNAPFAEE
jgi:hypothetical protein